MSSKTIGRERLCFGEAVVSEYLSGVPAITDDRRTLSLLFTGFEARAADGSGRIQSRTVTIAVPMLGERGGDRVLIDVHGRGEVTDDARGRWSASAVTLRKVRSVFRKSSADLFLHWEQTVSPAGLLLTSITVSAMLDHSSGGEAFAIVDSIDLVML